MKSLLASTFGIAALSAVAFTAFLFSPEIGAVVIFFGGLGVIVRHDYARPRRILPGAKARIVRVTPPDERLKLAA